jgi:hypothetical protein
LQTRTSLPEPTLIGCLSFSADVARRMRLVESCIRAAGMNPDAFFDRRHGAEDLRVVAACAFLLEREGLDFASISGLVGRSFHVVVRARARYDQDLNSQEIAFAIDPSVGAPTATRRLSGKTGRPKNGEYRPRLEPKTDRRCGIKAHGTKSAYYSRKCRCDVCVTWHKENHSKPHSGGSAEKTAFGM